MSPVGATGPFLAQGVASAIQFKGLPDGAKRCLNRASSDLISSTCMPFTDKSGKTSKDVNPFSVFNSSEKRVQLRVESVDAVWSTTPWAASSLARRQTTSEFSLVLRWSSSHEVFCWRGKSALNLVRNWRSVRS